MGAALRWKLVASTTKRVDRAHDAVPWLALNEHSTRHMSAKDNSSSRPALPLCCRRCCCCCSKWQAPEPPAVPNPCCLATPPPPARYMDSKDDEQARGITMKSSSISLLFVPGAATRADGPNAVPRAERLEQGECGA